MLNKIQELTGQNEVLESQLEVIRTEMDAATTAANLALGKIFQELTGIPDVTVVTGTDKTVVGIPRGMNGGWANEISIYHYENYGKADRRFEINWFASTATVATDATDYNYLKYLQALGRIAEAFSAGTFIQDTILNLIEDLRPIKSRYTKCSVEMSKNDSEIRNLKRAQADAAILEMISGPVVTIPVVGNHLYENRQKFTKPAESSAQCWQLSARNTVVFDCLTIIKNKGNWKVIFHELGWTRNDAGDTVKSHYDLKNCETKGFKQDAMIEMLKYLMPGIKAANLITA